MSQRRILYAKVGGPPNDWWGLKILNLDTGLEVLDVVEVDTEAGWMITLRRNAAGELFLDLETGEVARQRVEGRFEIRLPA